MRTKIIAHRGASFIAPENTNTAFRKALEMGADGFETDVQLTKEGEMVIHHNYTIDANSNGQGKISDMTLDQIMTFDFGSFKGEEFAGEKIAVFSDVLAIAPEFEMVNVELKAPMDRSIPYVKQVAEAIQRAELTDKILISAFDHSLLKEMKEILPEIKVGALILPPLTPDSHLFAMKKLLPDVPLNLLTIDAIPNEVLANVDVDALGIRGKTIEKVIEETISSMSALYPGATIGMVIDNLQAQQNLCEYVDSLEFKLDFLHPDYRYCILDPELVNKMHDRGIGVNVWTVDGDEEQQLMLKVGVDGIITNRPDKLLK